jgi:hypothetical protein
LAGAATCAQDITVVCLPTKLDAVSGSVLSLTEFLVTLTSFWMVWVHLAAS